MDLRPSTSKDVKKRPAKPVAVAEDAAAAAAPPPEILLELDDDLERGVYEHGLGKYVRQPPSYLTKTEIGMSLAAPPSSPSCLWRNLPGILIITIVVLAAAAVYMALDDAGEGAASSVYPTPEAIDTAKDENVTSTRDDVEAILQEAQIKFLGRGEMERGLV